MAEQRTHGTGSVFRRKKNGKYLPNWYVAYYSLNGRQQQESTGQPLKAVAERELRKKLDAVERGAPVEHSRKLRYEDIRNSLLTEYRNNHVGLVEKRGGKIHGMDYLDEFFQNMKVVNINTPRLREFVAKLQSGELQKKCRSPKEKRAIRPMKNGTINRILALLRRAMNLAHEDGLVHWVPYFPVLQENNVREGFVETPQFKILLTHLPEHLHPLLVFLYTTGCRTSAALRITWDMLNADARFLTLPPMFVKNKKPITLKLSDDLTAVLKKMFRQLGQPIFDGTNLRRAWAAATKKAGCPKLLVHDLRRSGARNLRQAGVEETVIMKIGGWLTRSVFIRYAIVATKDIEDAMDMLAKKNGTLIEPKEAAGD